MNPFTNIHAHVFTSACAPDRFLMIIPSKFLRKHPNTIKSLLDTKVGRATILRLFKLTNNKKGKVIQKTNKYLSFLDIGTDATQQKIFETAYGVAKTYDSRARVVGLTLNMQYMDNVPSKRQLSFETQLEQIKDVKRFYPEQFFPFLCVDPRHLSGMQLVSWAKRYFESGVVTREGKVFPYFSGIKLYPALGFFPFDPRLDDLYRYAQDNGLPVMTHCTRSGSQYIGNSIETLIPRQPPMLMPVGSMNMHSSAAQKSIYERIDRYYKNGWIANSDMGNNDIACDLFGHPENYIPLLEKYPNLKICLAHMGGSTEITKNPVEDKDLYKRIQGPAGDGMNWFDKIQDMMKIFPAMYTDISYTLSDLDQEPVLNKIKAFLQDHDMLNNLLSNRVLFGTDFFMTEQEKKEAALYALAADKLQPWFDQLTRVNTQVYLNQPL